MPTNASPSRRPGHLPLIKALTTLATTVPLAQAAAQAPAADDDAPRGPRPAQQLADMRDTLQDEQGLTFELGYTLIYQHATDTIMPSDGLLTGSYDFAGRWTLLEDTPLGAGTLGWLVEGGQILSHNDDEDLSANVGSALGVNDDLDDQSIAVTELWWQQQLADESITLTLGKIDQTVYFDANRIANDETTQFLASPLVNNSAVPFPDNGLGANLRVQPSDDFYITAGFGDGNADARETGFNTFDGSALFAASEVGFIANRKGPGEGRYRALLWRNETDTDTGYGFAVSIDQSLGKGIVPFLRYGIGDDDVTDFEQLVSVGVGVESPFNREGDLFAVGYVWSEPSDAMLDNESLVELFYRAQLTEHVAVTPDVQVIFEPGDPAADGVTAVLGVRVQATF